MQLTIDNINYKLIPSNITSLDSIKKNELILKNDIYEKYKATAEFECELIICNDIHLMPRFEKK